MMGMTTEEMYLRVSPAIWEKFPHLKLGVLVVEGMDNTVDATGSAEFLQKCTHDARNAYAQTDLSRVDKIIDWREAYRSFGFKPAQFRCSAESLLRRIMQGKDLPSINPLVNIYNAVSLKYTLPMGADDLDQVKGAIQLTVARGDEQFTALGSSATELTQAGEVVYRDDRFVTCKVWNWRECDQTKIETGTKRAIFVIEGLEHTLLGEIATALSELKDIIERMCGGKARGYVLDKAMPQMDRSTELGTRHIAIEIPTPDYHKHEAYQIRKAKLSALFDAGFDPYPPKYEPTHSVHSVNAKYTSEEVGTFEAAQEGCTDEVTIAGRLVLFRDMGKNIFGHILDETEKMQVLFNKTHTNVSGLCGDETPIKFIEKKVDLGDIIGLKGHLFRTQKGELTLYVKDLTLLCKTLLPLPDKHKGIVDKGTRYRKRWLDLITRPEVGEHFRMRSKILSLIRRYFENYEFLEVETPTLQNIYGGANARPFITHHNALSQDMYLRIALEIALKKLVVGGMHRVFEIGKVFRNEGIDRTHNPEFTMLESYAAYWDYNDVMAFTENLYAYLANELFGTTAIGMRQDKHGNEHLIDVKTPWIRMSMKDAIKTYGKIDVDTLSDDEMKKHLEGKVDADKLFDAKRGHLIAMFFEEYAEEHLIQPHHIIDHPIESTPLCKLHRDPKLRAEGIVERFESFILGVECCNAYTELNDPVLQRELLEDQARMREGGDTEANPMDEEFIEAICQGMPPAGGLGIGLDRLCMLFTGVHSIRDILYFPVMRPEE